MLFIANQKKIIVMSKAQNKQAINSQYKHFSINTLSDALLVLSTLISSSISNFDKFELYTKESIDLQEKYRDAEFIPADEYEELSDKILFRQRELLEFMADEANDIFSYRKLRKELVKKGYVTRQLENDVVEIINELHQIRNWTFHNVQSRLVAEREVMEKNIPDELKAMVKIEPQLNPIIVVKCKAYTKEMLDSFVYHNLTREVQFKLILDEMKQDYQDMYEQLDNPTLIMDQRTKLLIEDCKSKIPVRYVYLDQISDVKGRYSDVSNISMAIQKGKYDGTVENYKNHTGRNEGT